MTPVSTKTTPKTPAAKGGTTRWHLASGPSPGGRRDQGPDRGRYRRDL